MKRLLVLSLLLALFAMRDAGAASILTNGNLDLTEGVEVVPGFIAPKPKYWVNEGTRSITGAYEDEMSSEPWAGPAPTPVTTDGTGDPYFSGTGCGGLDCAVFFKPFSGNLGNGLATAHLYQDNPATAGEAYSLSAWAGVEANALAGGIELALEFLDAGDAILAAYELDLIAAGLFDDNGQPFDYKEFTVDGTAPVGSVSVRVRASMIDAMANPSGGGQGIFFDDFSLTTRSVPVPEPATLALFAAGLAGFGLLRRKR